MPVDLRKPCDRDQAWPRVGATVRSHGLPVVVRVGRGVYGDDVVWVRPASGGPGWSAPVSTLGSGDRRHDPAVRSDRDAEVRRGGLRNNRGHEAG